MNNNILLILLLFVLSIPPCLGQTSALYDITFASTWNSTDHGSLPGNAHWSKLVGATHKTSNAFLQIGEFATTGIKNIAETGNNTIFNTEVTMEISNGEADQYINGPNLGTATGDMFISDLEVTKAFPLLTLVSMIAPSPDWMIAINGYNLLDAVGNWKTSVTLDIFAYDSGTDSGTDYSSSNSSTDPFQSISMIIGSPFQGNKIGTLSITLKTVLGVIDFTNFHKVNVYPNPASDGKIVISNLKDVSHIKVEIINISGLQIKSMEENVHQNTLTLDIQDLTSGMYILKLTADDNNALVQKFVIK